MTRERNICPRCGGNLLMDQDEYDQHFYCLQCGFRTELKGIDGANYTTNDSRQEIRPSSIKK